MKKTINLLLFALVCTLFTTQCKKEDINKSNTNQTFEEHRNETNETLNILFQSFATNIDAQFDKDVRDSKFFLNSRTYINGNYSTNLAILYRDYSTIILNLPNTTGVTERTYRELLSGVYNWSSSLKKFIRTPNTTNTVVINCPLDSTTATNNVSITYSNLEMTRLEYKNGFNYYKANKEDFYDSDFYGYGTSEFKHCKNGTETIKVNNIELSKTVYDNDFTIDYNTSSVYTFRKGNITKYYKGNLSTKYSYNEDSTYKFIQTLYEVNKPPTIIKYNFKYYENNVYKPQFFNVISENDLRDLDFLTIELFAYEHTLKGTDKLWDINISKGNDVLSLNLDLSQLTTTEGNYNIPLTLSRYNIIESVVNGYLTINNELIFNLTKENNTLYTDYIKDNKRVNANDYLIPNFNPIEDEIENKLVDFFIE